MLHKLWRYFPRVNLKEIEACVTRIAKEKNLTHEQLVEILLSQPKSLVSDTHISGVFEVDFLYSPKYEKYIYLFVNVCYCNE